MKTKVINIILIISLGVNLGLIASYIYQQLTNKKSDERFISKRSWRHGRLRYKLKLDENQLKIVEALHETTLVKMKVIRETLELKRTELINSLKEAQPDNTKIQTLVKEIANLQAQVELGFTENILAMKKVLKPEQQQQFFELFGKRLKGKKMFAFHQKELKHKHLGENKNHRKGGHHDY